MMISTRTEKMSSCRLDPTVGVSSDDVTHWSLIKEVGQRQTNELGRCVGKYVVAHAIWTLLCIRSRFTAGALCLCTANCLANVIWGLCCRCGRSLDESFQPRLGQEAYVAIVIASAVNSNKKNLLNVNGSHDPSDVNKFFTHEDWNDYIEIIHQDMHRTDSFMMRSTIFLIPFHLTSSSFSSQAHESADLKYIMYHSQLNVTADR